MVRTPPFHGGDFGSTPCGATNGDCGVMVSTNDCGSFSQGSSPAVTQIKFNIMVVLLIVLVSFLISIPLAKEMAEVYGDDDPFTNWRKKRLI